MGCIHHRQYFDALYLHSPPPAQPAQPCLPTMLMRLSVARAAQAQLAATPAPPCPEFSTLTWPVYYLTRSDGLQLYLLTHSPLPLLAPILNPSFLMGLSVFQLSYLSQNTPLRTIIDTLSSVLVQSTLYQYRCTLNQSKVLCTTEGAPTRPRPG